MSTFRLEYNPEDWQLFIDPSKVSLNAVIIHNGNKVSLLLIAHAANMKNLRKREIYVGKNLV